MTVVESPGGAVALREGAQLRERLLHEGWEFALASWQAPEAKLGFSTLEWRAATVPGHVHVDLLAQGIIAEPFAAMHELGCQWVDRERVSYRARFDFEPDPRRPQRVLRFEGLDTVCSVMLNGQLLAEHANMFVPLELDVSGLLITGQNLLQVTFEPAAEVGERLRAQYFQRERLALDTERFPERSFVRKAQFMFGWDWGPRLVSAGIWRPVRLLEYAARIEDIHVLQEHAASGSVTVSVRSVASAGSLIHVLDGVSVHAGDGCIARISEPQLWYPHGMGAQPLYELDSYLCPADFDQSSLSTDPQAARLALSSVALDHRRTRIGLRTVRLRREPDALGESFELEVNGKPLWVMGANYIPDHSFPSTVRGTAIAARVRAACDAGMNMLRVWGGGLFESSEFYAACDEAGLLVWQDFPFACAYYPDDDAFCAEVASEARVNIERLRNHASLALWCGNNENEQLWQQKWGKAAKHPPRYYGQRLYDEVLPASLARYDPQRPYIRTSPIGGADCNSGGSGDQHYWDVWHGRGDWVHYRDSSARFSSEYGFASACSLTAWRAVYPGTSPEEMGRIDVRDAAARWHEKTAKGYETFLQLVQIHYPASRDLQDWIYYSQLNQRDALRFALEHYRRTDACKGSLIWQLNDCWPTQSWALIDSAGERKPAWFELRRLYASRLLSLTERDQKLAVHAALDNAHEPWSAVVSIEAVSLVDGTTFLQVEQPFHLAPGERRELTQVSIAGLPRSSTLVVARAGDVVAHKLLGEPKELALPPASAIEVVALRGDELELRFGAPVVDLVLTDASGASCTHDNCFTIPRPGARVLPGYTAGVGGLRARSLAGEHAVLWPGAKATTPERRPG